MEKNWERSTKSFNDKHIYPNDKSQALNQMSYALRTLSPESYKHLKTNVLQNTMNPTLSLGPLWNNPRPYNFLNEVKSMCFGLVFDLKLWSLTQPKAHFSLGILA